MRHGFELSRFYLVKLKQKSSIHVPLGLRRLRGIAQCVRLVAVPETFWGIFSFPSS